MRPAARVGGALTHGLLLLPCVGIIVAVFAYPVAQILLKSLFDASGLTLKYYARFFAASAYPEILWRTVKWSAVITGVCLLLGYPVAYALSSVRRRTFDVLVIFVILPFFMSLLIRTYAWMILLGRQGPLNRMLLVLGVTVEPLELLNNSFAVVVGMVQILLPFMIVTLLSVMRGIDRTLVRAAHTLGANPLRAFFAIFVPLSAPGIGAGCLLVFITSVGFFVTPAVLGGPKDIWIAMLIETQVTQLVDWGFAAALSGILLVVIVAVFLVYERFWGLDRVWGEL